MLDALRRGSTGLIAKAFLGLLIISFAVWGVADVFRGFGQGSLAKVGDVEIGADEFQTAYRNQLDMLGQLGRRLTPEQARQFGLDVRALYGLIDTAAVDGHARRLSLGVSNETVAQQIAREPSFRTSDGKFDKQGFEAYLRQIRMSEAGFLAQRRRDEVREQLTGTLMSSLVVPDAALEIFNDYRNETRKIEHMTLPEGAVTVPEADEAKLKETWEQAKRQFVVPETRKLAILLLEQEAVKARVAVTDADIKAYFDANRATLDVPERRRIQQIAFKDRAAAETAKKAIDGGKSFMMVALETEGLGGRLPGLVARSDIGDLKLAEVAFSLPRDKVSDVVPISGGAVLLMVGEIAPGQTRTLEEVKEEIREKLVATKIADEMNSLHDSVDNNRAARKPLKEIAESLKLKYLEPVVGRDNLGPDGKPVIDHPEASEVIEHGFQASVGTDSEPMELKSGGFAWVDALAVTPEKEKPLEQVKDEVKALYVDVTRRRLIADLAAKLVERANAGEPMATLAKEVKATVETTEPINRSTTPQGLSQSAVQLAFSTAKGRAASAESPDRKSRTVFTAVETTPAPALAKDQADRLRAELARQMQTDAIQAYAVGLRDELGVTINQANLRRLTGADRQ
jgi:peptidyl-prolyl cis-trans isomerase D